MAIKLAGRRFDLLCFVIAHSAELTVINDRKPQVGNLFLRSKMLKYVQS